MRNLTLNDVERISDNRKSWTLKLEDPASGETWLACGRAQHQPVDVLIDEGLGTVEHDVLDYDTFRQTAQKLVSQGFEPVATHWIRVRDEVIDSFMKLGRIPTETEVQAHVSGTLNPATPSTAQATPTAPTAPATVAPAPTTAGTNLPPMGTPRAGAAPLTPPFNKIRGLQPKASGNYDALDAQGTVILNLPQAGAQELARDYGIPILGLSV